MDTSRVTRVQHHRRQRWPRLCIREELDVLSGSPTKQPSPREDDSTKWTAGNHTICLAQWRGRSWRHLPSDGSSKATHRRHCHPTPRLGASEDGGWRNRVYCRTQRNLGSDLRGGSRIGVEHRLWVDRGEAASQITIKQQDLHRDCWKTRTIQRTPQRTETRPTASIGVMEGNLEDLRIQSQHKPNDHDDSQGVSARGVAHPAGGTVAAL